MCRLFFVCPPVFGGLPLLCLEPPQVGHRLNILYFICVILESQNEHVSAIYILLTLATVILFLFLGVV